MSGTILESIRAGDHECTVHDLMDLSKAAEQAERYNDMCEFMKEVIKQLCEMNETLEQEHRNMLSVAYKNVVGTKRQSMRSLADTHDSDKDQNTLNQKYLGLVESEVISVCNEVLNVVVSGPLIPLDVSSQEKAESTVFWLKMCGDYCRYLAEIGENKSHVELHDASTKNLKSALDSKSLTQSSLPSNKQPKEWASFFYQEAMEKARAQLPETHPTRLGLALNYSVCHYEILDQKDEATTLAKAAFDAAIEKLDTLNDSSYKDSTLIMQLLRDNLTLWTASKDDAGDADDN